jgi:hypothetical protein
LICIVNPALAVVVLILVFARKDDRQAIASWLRLLVRQSEWLDFRAARSASGQKGEVQRADGFVIWTDVPGDWTSTVSTISARTLQEFSRLTGTPAQFSRPVRILFFDKQAAFSRYRAKSTPNFGGPLGVYSGLFRKRVVLLRDMPDKPSPTFESVLTHEMTHHFTRCNIRARPLWLDEGLAGLVSRCASDAIVTDAPAQRWLKAALARGQILTGKELFSVTNGGLDKRSKDWRNLEDASYFVRFYAQSAALLGWLRRTDEEGFKRFFAGLGHTRRWIPVFRSCFNQSPEEAVEHWTEELRRSPLLPLPAVPPALEQRVRERPVNVVANAAAPRDERLRAIRWLGGGGYLCGAEALISVLENPADDLRPEAQRALENIAGELLGADPAAWRRWMLSANALAPVSDTAN